MTALPSGIAEDMSYMLATTKKDMYLMSNDRVAQNRNETTDALVITPLKASDYLVLKDIVAFECSYLETNTSPMYINVLSSSPNSMTILQFDVFERAITARISYTQLKDQTSDVTDFALIDGNVDGFLDFLVATSSGVALYLTSDSPTQSCRIIGMKCSEFITVASVVGGGIVLCIVAALIFVIVIKRRRRDARTTIAAALYPCIISQR